MLALPAHIRIFLYHHPMSMRKSFEGLSAAVEQLFPGELLSSALFVFLEGRLISSRNAIKHGFLAQNILIKGEHTKALEEFKEAIYCDINPQSAIEELLVEKLIAAAWRWKQLVKVEGQIFDDEDIFDRGKGPTQAFNGSSEELLALMRYESGIEKAFYRALHELQRLQGMRLGQPVWRL